MKLLNKFAITTFLICCVILLSSVVYISCSSKTDEQKKDEAPSPTVFEKDLERLKQENAELKNALSETLTFKEEAKRLRQEIDELKIALAQATGSKDQSAGHSEEKEKDKAHGAVAQFDPALSAEEKIKLLESLRELSVQQDASVISFVLKALDDPNQNVGRAAIQLLESYKTPEILPVIERALKAEDEATRAYALTPLSGINDPQVADLLNQALGDTSKFVRRSAIEVAEGHRDDIKNSVMEEGITSPYDDVKYASASMLEVRSDHTSMEILLEALKDNNADFRSQIFESIHFLVGERFETYEQAQAWWMENKDQHDAELFRIEGE